MDATGNPVKVCIIGAGPSGLLTLFRFLQLGDPVPEVVCYDKQSTWGGQWNFTWRTGTDVYGELVHSSVYQNLWTNVPTETIELPHYTYEQHFGRPIPSYMSQPVIRDYIGGLFKISKHNMEDRIKYNTSVRNVHYNETTDDFTVLITDLPTKRVYRETFSHVIVATGIYTTPFVPDIEGIESFPGLVLHTHHVKRSEIFQGKRVLLIGSAYSAEDMAAHCQKYGADHVIIAFRTRPRGFDWPDKIEERPMVIRFTKNNAEFKDGTTAAVDVVIYCTGYIYHHPFLDDNLRIEEIQTIHYPKHLYRGLVWQKAGNQKLLYIGVQTIVHSIVTFDVQATWIVAYITGKIPLDNSEKTNGIALCANRQDIEKDIRTMQEKYQASHTIDERVDFFNDYIQSIADETGYEIDFRKHTDMLMGSLVRKADNLMSYRNCQYTSIYTGKLAPKIETPWVDLHDTSLEYFMKLF